MFLGPSTGVIIHNDGSKKGAKNLFNESGAMCEVATSQHWNLGEALGRLPKGVGETKFSNPCVFCWNPERKKKTMLISKKNVYVRSEVPQKIMFWSPDTSCIITFTSTPPPGVSLK